MTAIAEYRDSKELFLNLTLRDLRSKYRRSVLGWTWSMLNPLASMVVYTIVFSFLIRVHPSPGFHGLDEYALFLLSAMLPWNFFTTSITGSVSGVTGAANLIKKTYFPRELLPASATAAGAVMHLIEMGLLTVVILAFGNYTVLTFLPLTLVLIAIVAVFAFGVGLLFSAVNVFFRDVEHFTQILFLVWFYVTPIIYPPETVAKHHVLGLNALTIAKVNPMTDIAICFRDTMYYGRFPGAFEFGYGLMWALAALAVGLYVFNRLTDRFAEEL